MAAKVRWYRDAWWVRTHANGRRTDRRVGPTTAHKTRAEKLAKEHMFIFLTIGYWRGRVRLSIRHIRDIAVDRQGRIFALP